MANDLYFSTTKRVFFARKLLRLLGGSLDTMCSYYLCVWLAHKFRLVTFFSLSLSLSSNYHSRVKNIDKYSCFYLVHTTYEIWGENKAELFTWQQRNYCFAWRQNQPKTNKKKNRKKGSKPIYGEMTMI